MTLISLSIFNLLNTVTPICFTVIIVLKFLVWIKLHKFITFLKTKRKYFFFFTYPTSIFWGRVFFVFWHLLSPPYVAPKRRGDFSATSPKYYFLVRPSFTSSYRSSHIDATSGEWLTKITHFPWLVSSRKIFIISFCVSVCWLKHYALLICQYISKHFL